MGRVSWIISPRPREVTDRCREGRVKTEVEAEAQDAGGHQELEESGNRRPRTTRGGEAPLTAWF